MAYRTFRDSQGTDWQTWDVVPRLGERRVAPRRITLADAPATDRRARVERRLVRSERTVLNSSLTGGWLCFEAEVGKRRLSPIPGDWQHCAPERLEGYCHSATPARRMTRDLRVADMGERNRPN